MLILYALNLVKSISEFYVRLKYFEFHKIHNKKRDMYDFKFKEKTIYLTKI